MPRKFTADGVEWTAWPSGRNTQYLRDEFGLLFVRGTGLDRERRVTRYSPTGARIRDLSMNALSDAELCGLLAVSAPAAMTPETGYQR